MVLGRRRGSTEERWDLLVAVSAGGAVGSVYVRLALRRKFV